MTTATAFRNVDFDQDSPVDQWPYEALETIVDRGTIDDWRLLAAEIRRRPWGCVARSVTQIIEAGDHYGVDALFSRVIAHERAQFRRRAREADGAALKATRRSAGLSLKELSARSGVSVPNLSKYETGVMSPTLDVVARIEHACRAE